ncbi:hypothetical protein PN499_21660 [Kamptonema animale CS-326]|jgi:hypothetical protein|uniref:hypothetical protein n=1 Tax=Kamptonema animale TaxID=92934 RepID=UPI00232B9CF1|nr:hypothetical protein [Kamptonema animale]MDB9513808.1 hypothetical protein [Kamptonema animale CS-326]
MTARQTSVVPWVGIDKTEIEQIEKLYTLRERSEGLKFLDNHPFLVPVLLQAPDKIRDYFPDNLLILDMAIDPESSSPDDDKLVLLIATDIDADDSVDRLWELDNAWWLNAGRRSQHKMFIDLE